MNRLTRIALILLVLLVIAAPAIAQDVTATVTPDVIVTPVPVPADDTVTLPSWAITNLAVLLVAASSITTIVSLVLVRGSFKSALAEVSKSNKDAVEAAYQTTPEHVQGIVDRVVSGAERVLEEAMAILRFVREVTDGQPNAEPPAKS